MEGRGCCVYADRVFGKGIWMIAVILVCLILGLEGCAVLYKVQGLDSKANGVKVSQKS